MKTCVFLLAAWALLSTLAGSVLAQTNIAPSAVAQVIAAPAGALEQVQKYERAIHVMAMLLVGFGFLMVFVRKYGRADHQSCRNPSSSLENR